MMFALGILACLFIVVVLHFERISRDKQQEYELLAIELWSIFDRDGAKKWPTISKEEREHYLDRARYLINQGWRQW